MKFEYVCKPVFCEHNLPVEATYINVTKPGRKGPMTYKNPYFFATTWPNQMGSALNCRKIVFRNRYPNADCNLLGTICTVETQYDHGPTTNGHSSTR